MNIEILMGTSTTVSYHDPAFISGWRPFLHANFVSEESGSGLVHIAPGHGKDDYQLCLLHGIPAFAPLNDEGRFTDLASPHKPALLSGKEVLHDGNRSVINRKLNSDFLLLLHVSPFLVQVARFKNLTD